jgi:hypothetical protein
METFKNTLGFIAAGLVLVVISTAQEPKASGPWVQGYGTLAPGTLKSGIATLTKSASCRTLEDATQLAVSG